MCVGYNAGDMQRPFEEQSHRAPLSNRLSFGFHPSHESFTSLNTEHEKAPYRTVEERAKHDVAPPSSVWRPNYDDNLRRVSVVLFQHLCACEQRLYNQSHKVPHRPILGTTNSDIFSSGKSCADILKLSLPFHQGRYISPQYLYTFAGVGVRSGLHVAGYSVSEKHETPEKPTVTEIFQFLRTLFVKVCLSGECSLVCLIYIERLVDKAHVPLLSTNWKSISLCGLLLASKVWQDLSSWNSEFSTIYPQFKLKSINNLERTFLQHISWDLYISSSLYAKYYFALRSFTGKQGFRQKYNYVLNIDVPGAKDVAERSGARSQKKAKLNLSLSL